MPKRAKKAPPKASKKKVKKPDEKAINAANKKRAKEVEKKVAALIERIREGMPSVSAIKTMPLGILRKQKEWEKRARPLLAEVEQLIQGHFSPESIRPGRETDPL